MNIIDKVEYLATIIDPSLPGYTRRPFTKWNLKVREWLIDEMNRLNLSVSIDAASNIIGTLEGTDNTLPPIMVGSHTDSVIGGGKYDGVIGVLAGLAIVEKLHEEGRVLRHPLKIVDFTAEEASDFGLATIGSRGMVGALTEKDLLRKDSTGRTLAESIDSIGGNTKLLTERKLKSGECALYLELHIEQGPVLENTQKDLGVVTGVVGIERYRITVHGQPNHSGTTPMQYRQDALVATSEIIIAIESIAHAYGDQIVATVGKINNYPNAPNIIPGQVEIDLELRSMEKGKIEHALTELWDFIDQLQVKREIHVESEHISSAHPTYIKEHIFKGLFEVCSKIAPTKLLTSGAGHDGVQIGKVAPMSMIFVPSKNGKSHCPEEWTDPDLINQGVKAMYESVCYFDTEGLVEGERDAKN